MTADQVREATGWEPAVDEAVGTVPPPTAAELRLPREDMGPGRVHPR